MPGYAFETGLPVCTVNCCSLSIDSNLSCRLCCRCIPRAAITTNSVTCVVIVLATATIGAVFTSTATDTGISGILDRYRQISKILSPSSKTVYAGKTIGITKRIAGVESNFRLGGYGLEKAVMLRSGKIGDREKLTKEYCCF